MNVERTDIIIIGGGLLGTAIAYQLACRTTKKIVLLERHDIASQATSRAACLLTKARTKYVSMQMVQETYDCILRLENELGESLDLQQVGSVSIASSAESLQNLNELATSETSLNIQNEWISNSKVQDLLPWICTNDVLGALYMPTDAYIDSAQLCNGYAKAAKQRGVTLRTHTSVKELMVENKQIVGVRLTNNDELHAPIVINAAGSWSNFLSFPHGDGLPMTPVRSHFWISESNENQFPKQQPFVILPDARAFTRPDVGALIIGIREPDCVAFNPETLPDNIDQVEWSNDNGWSTLASTSKDFTKYYPDFNNLGIAHYVAGPSCYVPDGMFVIGKSEKTNGLFHATGCCGGGVAASGGIGRLVAEQVLNEETFVDASFFNPMRFGEINPFDEIFQQQCANARSNKKGG